MRDCKHGRVIHEGGGRTRCLLCGSTQATKNGRWRSPLDRLYPLRGYTFLPEGEELERIPALYETERIAFEDKTIHLHYFIGACDWYIAELNPDTLLAFGFANLGDDQSAEWGYVDLDELAGIQAGPLRQPVERDLHFTPRFFSVVMEQRQADEALTEERRVEREGDGRE